MNRTRQGSFWTRPFAANKTRLVQICHLCDP